VTDRLLEARTAVVLRIVVEDPEEQWRGGHGEAGR
jgi:hypothetical protein